MAFLGKLTVSLSRVHPLIYWFIYFAAIPAFGLLYYLSAPHGFYAPYTRYEPAAISDEANLTSSIKEALLRSLKNSTKKPELIIRKDLKIVPGTIEVSNLKSIDLTQISFQVRIYAKPITNDWDESLPKELKEHIHNNSSFIGPGAATLFNWTISLTIPERKVSIGVYTMPPYELPKGFSADNFKLILNVIEGDEEDFYYIFRRFGVILDGSTLEPKPIVLYFNPQELSQLKSYLKGMNGDPSEITNFLPRMIYLSAVVITTLGLGDIIPITPVARMLVAFEAIFGVAIAGLFLNALAYRTSPHEEEKMKSETTLSKPSEL